MLTDKDFCDATSVWNCDEFGDELSWVCQPDDVVRTADTVADFQAARSGAPDEYETPLGVLYVWENQQARKGARRGEVFVLDAGDYRLSYFSGQV
tara:strand:- start:1375 stop:1659 length:285 start_codon:yes stop_codon:yes gene_type:complete